MWRKLAVFMLLVPISFNGLWMVCAGEEIPAGAQEEATPGMAETAECSAMCLVEKPQQTGVICLITADDSKSILAIFMFGGAVVQSEFSLARPFTAGQHLPELSRFYSDPALHGSTPPPRV